MSLHDYLRRSGQRVRRLVVAWAVAGTLLAAALVTVAGGWLVATLVPSATTLLVVRVALGLALLAALLVLWLRRPGEAAVAARLESRIGEFGGRLATWLDARRRGDASDLFTLLTRQTGDIAQAHPPHRAYPARQLLVPGLLAVLAAGIVGFTISGSAPWQLAAQRLWAGDLLSGSRPHLVVTPGDVVVRRGSDVVVEARALGFRPDMVEISADFGGGSWERAPMSALGGEAFAFVLVGVTEPTDYYVSARGLASSRFRIRVADLPRVTAVETVQRPPAWTGRDALRHQQGDVTALPGTEVAVTAFTDRPVAQPLLVVDGVVAAMSSEAAGSAPAQRGAFTVAAPGSWYVAVRHEGALARISDEYLIEVAEDAPPEVAFTWPGHDRRATAIEEVALTFEATDDYGVEALSLHYAVNGGAWQEISIPGGSHVLELESMTVGDTQRPLAPGDVISFHAQARDHSQSVRSSLYFVDVRPFEMRYHESQQMAGQGGAEGSGFDIAQRQRDLLSATWNLINKRADMEPRALADESAVLAMLQRTLSEQVQTLVTRSAARGLGIEAEMSGFIEALQAALEDMQPAAGHLQNQELDQAVPAEQRALAHLSAAEASVRDVQVSMSRDGGRGASGRSLSELVELEMDPQRNRYEVPQEPGLGGDSPADDAAEQWQRLDELAARQERLARRDAAGRDSLPARWEQARLRRELEQMRDELAAQQGGSSQQAAQQGGGSQSRGDAALERAIGDIDEARQSLEQPSDPPTERQRAADAMRRAAESLRAASRGNLEERLGRAERQVANLTGDQRRIMEALQGLQRESLERARRGEGIPHADFGLQTFAEVKRRMQSDVAELRGELTDLSAAVGGRDPDTARILERAVGELDDARLDERLAASAEAFELGQPLYVIGSEAVVEQALDRLARRMAQAERTLADGTDALAGDPLRQVRALQRRLDEAEQAGGVAARSGASAVSRELEGLVRGTSGGAADGAAGVSGRPVTVPETYWIRGTDDANTATLIRSTRERLDLVEAMLASRDTPPIRAQEPRAAGRDSAAAARYFRELSRAAATPADDPAPPGDRAPP